MPKPLMIREKIAQARAHGGDALGLAHDPILQMAAIGAARGGFAETASPEDFELWLRATEAGSKLGAAKAEGWNENLEALQEAAAETCLNEFRERIASLLQPQAFGSLWSDVRSRLETTMQALTGSAEPKYEAIISSLSYEMLEVSIGSRSASKSTATFSAPFELQAHRPE